MKKKEEKKQIRNDTPDFSDFSEIEEVTLEFGEPVVVNGRLTYPNFRETALNQRHAALSKRDREFVEISKKSENLTEQETQQTKPSQIKQTFFNFSQNNSRNSNDNNNLNI